MQSEATYVKLDAHQHFWVYSESEYGWINDRMKALKRDFLPEDLLPLLQSGGYEGTIAVQARQSLEENDFLLELAERHPLIKGVVGWVDLCSPEAGSQLERYAANPKFKGVRHILQGEADDRYALRPDFKRGLSMLRQYDLAYDVLIFPRHLPHAAVLAAEFPDQRFVLDHIAKPDIKGGVLEPWEQDIRKLAALPNVYCKLSGMVTEADWAACRPEDFKPYLDVVFDAFGPDRLMIGSDWPVCLVSQGYGDVMSIVESYLAECADADKGKILGGNCKAFYKV